MSDKTLLKRQIRLFSKAIMLSSCSHDLVAYNIRASCISQILQQMITTDFMTHLPELATKMMTQNQGFITFLIQISVQCILCLSLILVTNQKISSVTVVHKNYGLKQDCLQTQLITTTFTVCCRVIVMR
eukprot:Pompholyxophrys_punicea_v1_NODE_97_length_3517_cov_29.967081.p5 type:complete len:129 gc:universal NODE_97_length_3517_cov_29.967081:2607-2993(+)